MCVKGVDGKLKVICDTVEEHKLNLYYKYIENLGINQENHQQKNQEKN